ncbi:MAG: molybdopterin-dependent oxidoreductase [Anaerolineales bacterium]|nr:MAG: molybdopterin-dependent oxidoreductase [Anaerolineales bacterium]
MEIHLRINDEARTFQVAPGDLLLDVLRREGYFGVKHGCEDGSCGACTVLLDGIPRASCTMLAAQAEGAEVTTIEGVADVALEGYGPSQGWRGNVNLHPIQQSFVETGAIQCGYCTPAMILAAKSLLETEPNPTEDQVRDALSGVLCRCTGYLKPVQAVLRAAAVLRGEEVSPIKGREGIPAPPDLFPTPSTGPGRASPTPPEELGPDLVGGGDVALKTTPVPTMVVAPETNRLRVVGKPEPKVDAIKLVQGKPAFAADMEKRGMLIGKLLRSPYAHARIRRVDASQARALPGVHAVLTYEDVPRVARSTAGQSHPIPGPLDSFSFDTKVRHVGDRVAAVAAETEEIAEEALRLIEVEYEVFPAILDPRDALDNPVVIHDEPDYVNFAHSNPERNLAAQLRIDLGDVDQAMEAAEHVFEAEYAVPRVQQAPIEPYVCITYWDEDDRLVFRTSTQVPFHIRRILAPVLGLPVKRIRVIKPRIGGGFGNKQEVMIEDACAHLTIATGRPVKMEYTRQEQFVGSTSRHPMIIKMRTGVMNDGTMVANEMITLADTGAYGNHALTVTGNTGHKAMSLYNAPNIRFYADIVYTNYPSSGAYRGYGVPQGFWAVESHMERICKEMGWDPIQFRLKNAVKAGDEHPLSKVWSEGREPKPEVIQTCALPEAVQEGAVHFGWRRGTNDDDYHRVPGKSHLRRGQGVAMVMQGTAIPYLDMGAASIKMNDDGSFNLLVGATDLGTGSDTVLGQMVAEVLGCPLEDVIVYSSDTDFTPFDKGAYASSTTYISGAAAVRAAEQVAAQIRERAAKMLAIPRQGDVADVSEPGWQPHDIDLYDRRAWAPDGRSVSLEEVALNTLHSEDQHQIMGIGSYVSPVSPPPFAAQFAEVTVDVETGQVTVDRLLMALDCGVIVNPATASSQVEGGMAQALGYAISEEMAFDESGRMANPRFGDYRIFSADEMPDMQVIFVETYEPSHPFGVKAVAEIPLDGVAPAVGNAVYDAVGVQILDIPLTPEKVWQALREKNRH